ncbi:cap-specific mRNA (nucleoside-2'-O-)-methyltransferase 1-like [Schistocerca gregaria]|uniref:cap-specific mRNA (nucleoside-2'-O-)-methyltransferase 1-like n=1 Tax=Schistocerca gregaria TaxID=7010 RepID=UPI00211E64AD|nr:cap-specific mRNA (nucleoside-2'-O-)-methyltransferase 1-like [Schistocerca gregaria]
MSTEDHVPTLPKIDLPTNSSTDHKVSKHDADQIHSPVEAGPSLDKYNASSNKRRKRSFHEYFREESRRPDLIEQTECYQIRSSSCHLSFQMDHEDLESVPVNDESRMLVGDYLPVDVVKELWKQKGRMDDLFDAGKGYLYYKVRDSQFPQDRRGSSKFANRAGDKLWQVHESVPIFSSLPSSWSFFDICGGPGAFSKLLLDKKLNLKKGFGMTLRVPMTEKQDYWYPMLENNPRFEIVWGKDNQGDIYVPENLCSAVDATKGEHVGIVVSDGGFKIQKVDGEHKENLQELFSGRIILSEFALMTMILAEKGHFAVKLFDTFSHMTASLIFIATQMFEEVYIVKPLRSRIVNSERYLVGKGFKKQINTEFCQKLLTTLHSRLYELHSKNPDVLVSPNSAVPIDWMNRDSVFMNSMKDMCSKLAEKQIKALKLVMDIVEEENILHKKIRTP